MKKFYLKSLTFAVMLLSSQQIVAYDFEVNGVYYNKNSDGTTVSVTSGDDAYSGSVVIPETVEYGNVSYTVTKIGSAFYGNKEMTSIEIPGTILSMDRQAFSGCTGLVDVYIQDLENWCKISRPYNSYYGYYTVNPLSYAKNLYVKGERITELIIPNGVTEITTTAFYGCKCITSLTIPSSVTTIGLMAFDNCTGLTEITFEPAAGTLSISGNAFDRCTGLTSVYISDIAKWCEINFGSSSSNPLSLGKRLYLNKKRVRTLEIPDNITGIGDYAFYNCSGLTSVSIGDDVTEIGIYAFAGCSELTSFTMGSNVNKIGGSAFYECKGLTEVHVKDIAKWCEIDFGTSGYSYNNPLYYAKSIYLNGQKTENLEIPDNVPTINASAFYGCTGILSVKIPNSVSTIGDYSFYGCSGLTSLTLGNEVNSIKAYAFYNCSSLEKINSLNPIPPVINNATTFYNVDKTKCVLNVPIDCKTEYELEPYWEEFLSINETDFGISGIDKPEIKSDLIEIARYSIDGQLILKPQRGINIVHYNDGSVSKIIEK